MDKQKIKEKIKFFEEQKSEFIKNGVGMAVLEINEIIHSLQKKLK